MQAASNWKITYGIYMITILILVIVCIWVPKGTDVLWINGHHTTATDVFFKAATLLGDGIVFVPVITGLLFIKFRYALMAALIAVSHGLLLAIAKQSLFHGVPRPKSLLDHDLLYFVPGVDVHATNSFPSGHTTTAFCLALFLALLFNKRLISLSLLIIALLVGYSRIYLLQHFLIDVAAGAVLGVATTFVIWQTWHARPKASWMDLRLTLNLKRRLPALPSG